MGVGTHDLSGIFTHKDISELFSRQLPSLEKLGMKADKENLHIIGLSNGGSAVNVAYNSFSRKFKTVTFISTGIHQTHPISSKVLLIGGGKDGSASSMPSAYNRLKCNGAKVDKYWQEDEGHFIFVNDREEIVDFLNTNIQSSKTDEKKRAWRQSLITKVVSTLIFVYMSPSVHEDGRSRSLS